MAKQKLNRQPLEDMIYDVLQSDYHPLEVFTGLDYFLAGTDTIWRAADRRIHNMPNYKLIGICNNIKAEKSNQINFDSYYDLFNYDYMSNHA